MTLTQQLEDKKKELLEWDIQYLGTRFTEKLEAEIAILEQAIAEMQKQRQEILDWIKEHEFIQNQGGYLIYSDDLEVYIKQLNQPKTEEWK